jgi:acyl-CoA reductase-like NAD-dependent aldehyde dehydrogenase
LPWDRSPARRNRLDQHLSGGQLHDAFGGFKNSGIGRESGQDAIHEYLETKSLWLAFNKDVPNPFIMR